MQMKYFDLVKPGTTHDFVKYRRVAVIASLIVNALVLLGVFVWPGLNYGVDFAGGTELQVHFKQPGRPGTSAIWCPRRASASPPCRSTATRTTTSSSSGWSA